MIYTDTCDNFAALAGQKVAGLKRAPLGFLTGTLLGGAYIGVAYVLALTVAAGLPAGVRPLVLGAVFGIGLILVVMAGAELFTGHVMYMTFGVSKGTVKPLDALLVLVTVWIGNLIGSILLATLFAKGGGGAVFAAPTCTTSSPTSRTLPYWRCCAGRSCATGWCASPSGCPRACPATAPRSSAWPGACWRLWPAGLSTPWPT